MDYVVLKYLLLKKNPCISEPIQFKPILFKGHLYLENPKDSIKKLLELINKFSKAAGYKINIQKLIAFLYTNNKTSGKKIKKTIPFTVASKTIK